MGNYVNVTPHMDRVLCELIRHEDSYAVSRELNLSRECVAKIVRDAEAILRTRLFNRKRGTGNYQWQVRKAGWERVLQMDPGRWPDLWLACLAYGKYRTGGRT